MRMTLVDLQCQVSLVPILFPDCLLVVVALLGANTLMFTRDPRLSKEFFFFELIDSCGPLLT
jgi:hypothetical protein